MRSFIYSGKFARTLMALLIVFMAVSSIVPTVQVHAETPTPVVTPVPTPPPGTDPGDLMTVILNAFRGLASSWFFFAYSLMSILFVVGFVRSALFMQGAQALGFSQGMSREMIQIAGGIACFALAMVSFLLANWIIGQLGSLVPTSWDITTPKLPQ